MNQLSKVFIFVSAAAFWSIAKEEACAKPSSISINPITHQEQLSLDTLCESLRFFPRFGEIPYYYHKQKRAEMRQLEQEKKWRKLQAALVDYISHFGVQNFHEDIRLIWKLAKLTELLDGIEYAKFLYRLALRQHHEGIDLKEIELYYDILNQQEIEAYVPIDYYYKLVQHQKFIDTIHVPRSVLLNMGHVINSKNADYAPFLQVGNDVLFFTSRRQKPEESIVEKADEDIFFSQKDDNTWLPAQPLQGINTKEFNEGSIHIDQNGTTLYFVRCGSPDGEGDCDLYQARLLESGIWGIVKNLGPQVNSPAWDSHPSLSANGDTLYFASDRIDGFGLSDIYFTYKQKDKTWAKAQNMGPIINTKNNDVSPFIHPTRKVMYFSSNGHLYNFGGLDIYKSEWGSGCWTEPVNIGPLINGRGSEHYFTIDSKSRYLYYAKSLSKDIRGQDLYSFPLPMEAHPDATVSLRGSLIDEGTQEPFKGIVSIIDLDEGIEVSPKFLDEEGEFEFRLIDERNYLLIIQGEDFFRIEELFYLSGPREIHKTTAPISRRIAFKSIVFETAKADLKESMYPDLKKVIAFLQTHQAFYLNISGHTDSQGASTFNLSLSKERALRIKKYIIQKGNILPIRIQHEGYGNSQPLVEENTETNRALNRRVEFHLYRPEDDDAGDKIDED